MTRHHLSLLALTAALVATSPVAAQNAVSAPASKTLDIYVTDTEGGKVLTAATSALPSPSKSLTAVAHGRKLTA